MAKVYLLTGSPGSGKTTVIRDALARTRVQAAGFYTEEIRTGGVRQGFSLTTLNGTSTTLAHVSISTPHRVGKYGVDITNLDKLGVAALLEAIDESDVIVIDEIGKMELFSADFTETVLEIIGSGRKVLGTIMSDANPVADKIKQQPPVNLVEVTRANYQPVLGDLRSWLAAI